MADEKKSVFLGVVDNTRVRRDFFVFEYVFACMRVYVYDLNAFCIFCYLDLFEIEKKKKKFSCFFLLKK